MSNEQLTDEERLQLVVLRKVAIYVKDPTHVISLKDEEEMVCFQKLARHGFLTEVSGEYSLYPGAQLSDKGSELLKELEAKE